MVRPDLTAEVRAVTVARNREEDSVIAAGLQPGERVVIVGQERLGPGTKVQLKDDSAAGARAPGHAAP